MDETPKLPALRGSPSNVSSQGLRPTNPIAVTIAEMLALVAPTSMSIDQQSIFLQASVKALNSLNITAGEVEAVAPQVTAKVVRHQQIIHEISEAVHDKRKRRFSPPDARPNPMYLIDQEAQRRRTAARTGREREDAWLWERDMRIQHGMAVPPLQPPLTAPELANLRPDARSLGLKYGYLKLVDGKLVEVQQ